MSILLMSLILIIPPEKECVAHCETARAYHEFIGGQETFTRWRLWENLVWVHQSQSYKDQYLRGAIAYMKDCEVCEPTIYGWPAPIQITTVPR
jgi:hypothetical protein